MSDRTVIALQPCPFCGGLAVFGEITDPADEDNFGGHFITCSGCIATTDLRFASKEDPRPLLAEAWNRRADVPAADTKTLERLAARMKEDALRGRGLNTSAVCSIAEIIERAIGAPLMWPSRTQPEYDYREFRLTIDGGIGKHLPVRCVGSYCRSDGSVEISEVWISTAPGLSYDIADSLKYAVVAALAAEAEEQIESELTR